jgi:hypothetical protein
MKLILHLSSLIHCHIIKITHMTTYLMFMKSALRLPLTQRLLSEGTFGNRFYLIPLISGESCQQQSE